MIRVRPSAQNWFLSPEFGEAVKASVAEQLGRYGARATPSFRGLVIESEERISYRDLLSKIEVGEALGRASEMIAKREVAYAVRPVMSYQEALKM